MKDTTIISQNLYNYTSKNPFVPSEYMKLYEADYYAFQEYPRIGRGFYSTIVDKNGNNVSNNIIEAQKIWNKYFPWSEFRSGYWSETSIKCGHKKIIIINVPHYTYAMFDRDKCT